MDEVQLEARLLTTGAFWRYRPGTAPIAEFALASMGSNWIGSGVSTPVNDVQTNDISASSGDIATVEGVDPFTGLPDGNINSVTGLSTTNIIDNAQAGAGAPISSYVAQFNTSATLTTNTIGDPTGVNGIANFVNVTSGVSRAYLLADDGTGGAADLVEHYTIHFVGPTHPGIGINGNSGAGIATTSGFTVAWAPGGGLFLGQGASLFVSSGSGTYTDPATGGVYTYTAAQTGTTADIDVTYTSTPGALPVQSNNVLTMGGIQYLVGAWTTLDYTVAPPGGISDVSTLTTSFDARFV